MSFYCKKPIDEERKARQGDNFFHYDHVALLDVESFVNMTVDGELGDVLHTVGLSVMRRWNEENSPAAKVGQRTACFKEFSVAEREFTSTEKNSSIKQKEGSSFRLNIFTDSFTDKVQGSKKVVTARMQDLEINLALKSTMFLQTLTRQSNPSGEYDKYRSFVVPLLAFIELVRSLKFATLARSAKVFLDRKCLEKGVEPQYRALTDPDKLQKIESEALLNDDVEEEELDTLHKIYKRAAEDSQHVPAQAVDAIVDENSKSTDSGLGSSLGPPSAKSSRTAPPANAQ